MDATFNCQFTQRRTHLRTFHDHNINGWSTRYSGVSTFRRVSSMTFIEVSVPSQGSERSCICVLAVLIFIFDFGIVLTMWYFLLLFYYKIGNMTFVDHCCCYVYGSIVYSKIVLNLCTPDSSSFQICNNIILIGDYHTMFSCSDSVNISCFRHWQHCILTMCMTFTTKRNSLCIQHIV
jgi:hypothetical protein